MKKIISIFGSRQNKFHKVILNMGKSIDTVYSVRASRFE